MIDPYLFATFIATVVVLTIMPGPNVALIVANSVTHGARCGLLTVAGTSSAMVVQLALTGLGMAEVLAWLGTWLEWLRWVGVAYLVYLGIREWRAPPLDLTTEPEPRSARAIYTRALLVSLTNPKTLLFYGAFFPLFITGREHIAMQVAVLSVTFLGLAIAVDSSWAVAAAHARRLLASRGRLRRRLSASLLVGAGVGLALARIK